MQPSVTLAFLAIHVHYVSHKELIYSLDYLKLNLIHGTPQWDKGTYQVTKTRLIIRLTNSFSAHIHVHSV